MLLIIFYLLSGTGSINTFIKDAFPIAIIIILFEVLIYIMPLFIALDVNKIRHKNYELQEELKEIKNLMILQNELLRNQQPNHSQYFQQQPNNTPPQYWHFSTFILYLLWSVALREYPTGGHPLTFEGCLALILLERGHWLWLHTLTFFSFAFS